MILIKTVILVRPQTIGLLCSSRYALYRLSTHLYDHLQEKHVVCYKRNMTLSSKCAKMLSLHNQKCLILKWHVEVNAKEHYNLFRQKIQVMDSSRGKPTAKAVLSLENSTVKMKLSSLTLGTRKKELVEHIC